MASLSEIVARAQTIAEGRGIDPHQSPIIDNGLTAEALVPHAIRYVLERAANEDIASCLRSFDLTDGDNFPEEILRTHLDVGYLDGLPHSSYIPAQDYNRARFDALLTYWTANGKIFNYSVAATQVTLKTPAVPKAPEDVDGDLDLSEKLTTNAILVIAGLLTGEIPLATVLSGDNQ